MDNTQKKTWQFPWGYKESIFITLGLFVVGVMLQWLLGSFDFYLLYYPVNLILGVIMLALIVGLSFIKNNAIVRWLGSVPLSVTLIVALLSMTIAMGLIPQYAKVNTDLHIHLEYASFDEILNYILTRLGLKQVTSSWPFVILYNFSLFVLGLITARRFHNFKWKDYGFYLNHIGLWLFLFAAGYGSADRLRYVMYVNEGEVEWRVYDDNENVVEPDIAIKLHDFIMEEYPPRLAIIDKKTGDVQPKDAPQFYQIDEVGKKATLAGWDLTIKDYIHEAVRKTDTTFQSVPMAGSMPAVELHMSSPEKGVTHEGWVTCGSVDQFVMPMDLDENYALVMTKPEPKRFASDITVLMKEKSDEPIRATIEVNKPLTIGHWTIYQYDYDHALGKASRYSGFELVYDPWVNLVYLGIFLLALGALSMLWIGNKNRRV